MEKINEENKMLALTLVADSDATLIHKETIPILPRILHTQNTKKTEGRKTQYTMTIEKQEMSILPNFLHIVTCYLTIIKTDHINTFIDFVKDKCNNVESMGLDGSFILCNIKHKMQKFLEFTKQYNDFVHQNLEWFQQRLFDIYVTCNPYNHKFVGAPKITTKFRPLCQIVTREAKINESRKDSGNNTISNIVIIQTGIVTYSHHCMTISCITKDGDRNDVHCPSPVTDFTRIAQDTVLATLPFKQMILIINSVSFIIKTLPLGFYKVSYVELSTFIGVEMFSKTIYLVDWVDNKIRHSIVICYDIYGDIRWQWKLPFPVHPDIAVFQGTIYVPDTELNRVLLYKNHDRSSGCFLHLKNPYIRNLNIRLKEKGNVKLLIAEICHLSNGQLVVSDINHDCLLYISNEGDIVSRLSLPSTATDICRWNPNQIGVILPLEKQLRIIENLSETVRTVSLSQPYVRVCKLGKDKIACYSDKPSHLDILAIKNYNQVEIIHRINITFVVKSLAIENETQKLLIVTRGKAFQYNTSFGDGCHSSGDRLCSIKMVPRVLLSQVKCPPNFYAGSIDKTFVYLIDNSRMFAINDYNLMVNDLITNNQLNIYIDLVDVFSRNICVSEMLSSTLYLQDLTVSDKARHIPLSQSFGDEQPMRIHCLVITENNLIAGYDWQNKNIKIFTFDGQVLDSVKWNAFGFLKMCRWQSNTLVITDGDCIDNKYQLLTLKVEFPLSLVIYQTENRYDCITSLSNNQLVCSKWRDLYSVYVVEIDEIHSTLNEIKQIAIPETLSPRNELGNRNFITDIHDITVTAEDIIIVLNKRFIIFFNRDGQYLHSVRHYIKYVGHNDMMTVDDSLLYIQAAWDKCSSYFGYRSIVCLTQAGEYSGILLNKRIHRAKLSYPSINCKGPRFVGSYYPRNELYVQGLFIVNRESFSVARLQTDECPVEVKDFDISDEGKIVVCEKANNGNVKIFYESGELLCHRNIASLVGGVCFTEERDIMTTVPKTQEIFQLNRKDLEKFKVWQSQVPYGVIWRKVGNIYWCVHIELTECHCIKIDGDQVNILESVSLLNLDSGLHFPSITSQMNKEIFSNELINKLNYSAGFVRGGRSGKTGKKICKSRLKVRCGNYIAESMLGIDEISVRQLPYRTAMVPLSIPTFDEPVNYNFIDIKDRNSKLIKLDNDVSVLMFRETLTLISATGDILQHKQLPQQQPHLDICRWKDEQFIVVFGKEMMVFNRNLCRLKTIKTEKYYNTIYKYNDNQIVCGGHYIGDITQNERNKNYEKEIYNNRFYYFCKDPDACDSYYVDVVDINDGEIKYEVCRGKTKMLGKLEGEAVVFDVGVTSFGDVIVVRRETDKEELGRWVDLCFVEWYREKSLVRRIALEGKYYVGDNIHRTRLITVGKNVYIRDRKNSIYQIPGHIEQETSEDSEDLTLKDIKKYSLLKQGDNEVFHVLGFDISENSFMVFGIIPGRQSFAFFFYDK
ncbi:Hypothetical predicted protein [Octopus vulgaris]|uniref:Uncharacterized protein n=1 Tax=Octopus vulgaris TaxID=6645 RepID=A0AA36C0K5_OCTVU|nr:Hypothetical predicted protein [Octopus vulgaris]